MIRTFEDGQLILVDKPLHWTSFDVVKKLKFALKLKKIGHAGTLDPLATGLLILCSGRMTKKIDEYQAQEKEYSGTIVIGSTTPSFDLETDIVKVSRTDHISTAMIKKAAEELTGNLQQIPPVFSAVKVNGIRAYRHAREGKEIILKSKPVTVSLFETIHSSQDKIEFRIICSKGTYVRSLARDFGEILGTGAYLSALRRTRIGTYSVEDASTIDQLISQ